MILADMFGGMIGGTFRRCFACLQCRRKSTPDLTQNQVCACSGEETDSHHLEAANLDRVLATLLRRARLWLGEIIQVNTASPDFVGTGF